MSRWKRPPDDDYAEILRRMLALRGKTAADLTRMTGGAVLPQTTCKLLSGAVKVPMLSTWRAICTALACTVDGRPLEDLALSPGVEPVQMRLNGRWAPLDFKTALSWPPGTSVPLRGGGAPPGTLLVVESGPGGKRRLVVRLGKGEGGSHE